MRTAKVYRKDNAQVVHIPADLAYERSDIELEIKRVGDEIRIRPVRRPLTHVLQKFAKFGPDFMAEGRGDQKQAERNDR
ncbi:AbrB/MazE/SpoVT family DNA-binding domain-containing protein [Burkholderia contaminans]|uniref:AbrB family transcriptional regulator n=1 Tax=Burkholderia contaminans TaxID=488447 RepID=UPI001CF433C5|nr:AbrB family transcriptional regulator [Burkholderia contaminans]MCA8101211.1 AbrB family transcriptional regulator [Burkholderia contaminans]